MENKISVSKIQSLNDDCPNCGNDLYCLYFVEEWGRIYCEECLDAQCEKWEVTIASYPTDDHI